jgi:hypothetical protein
MPFHCKRNRTLQARQNIKEKKEVNLIRINQVYGYF